MARKTSAVALLKGISGEAQEPDANGRYVLDTSYVEPWQWMRDLIDGHREQLPPMTADQEASLLGLLRLVAYLESKNQEKRDEFLADLRMKMRSRQAASKRASAKETTYAKIRDAYEAAAKEGRVASMDELMRAGDCKRDTVYRALKPSPQGGDKKTAKRRR